MLLCLQAPVATPAETGQSVSVPPVEDLAFNTAQDLPSVTSDTPVRIGFNLRL